MRDSVETPSGLVLRRWTGGDAASVLAAFADPLMRGQSVTPVDALPAAEQWIAQRAARWSDAFAFAVVNGKDTVLGQVSARAAGFAVEGLERQKLIHDGVRHDVETPARLATDPEPAPG
ncbi:hypothetical protein [Streptomyces sp. NPDC055299]